MNFIKKISVFTVALILMLSVVTLFTNGSLNVKASEETVGGVTKTYQTTVINSNAEELGIPESLDFNFNYKDEDLTLPYTLNGFKYSRPSGTLTAELCEDAATIETIGITDQVPSQYVSSTIYENLDFTQFKACKNIVIEISNLSTTLCNKVSQMPALENVYILSRGACPYYLTNETLKNVIFTYGVGNSDIDTWDLSDNLNLSSYNKNVKFVTLEGYFPLYKVYMDTYRNNRNYTIDYDLKIHTIPNNECPVPESRRIGAYYVEYGGGYYMQSRLKLDSTFKYSLITVDESISKIVIDPDAFTSFRGVFATPNNKLTTVYALGEVNNLQLLKTESIVQEVPTTFTYENYSNAETVTFIQSSDSATSINITTDSIGASDEVTTKFYYPKTITINNTSENTSIESAFSSYTTTSETPKVEIVDGSYSYTTTDFTMTTKELKAELNKIINPPATDENKPSTDVTDEIKDGIEDIKDNLNEFKDELKKSKSLQTVTAILSIILSLGLFYLIYVGIKKLIKWFKKR